MNKNLQYYKNLDGIRGIAALMVVVFHFFTYEVSANISHLYHWQRFTEFGQHGVSLFFVLSGFVITRILINTRDNKGYFTTFYKRRILRILPLYYLFLIFYYFIFPVVTDQKLVSFSEQLPVYFYLQNLGVITNLKSHGPGHYWSLAVEEHFYLLWPLVVFFIKPNNLWKFIGIGIIIVFLLKYIMLSNGLSINYFTFTRIDQIMMGALLANLEYFNFFNKKKSSKIMILSGLAIIPLAFIIYYFKDEFYFLKEMMKYFLLGLLFFSMIGTVITLNERNVINRILTSATMQYLGKISYGIYIWHILALLILISLDLKNVWLNFVLTILLTIGFAHLSFYYFESYFLRLKDKKIGVCTLKKIQEFTLPDEKHKAGKFFDY